MDWIKEIVKHYGIKPIVVDQVSNSLFCLKDNTQKYALKQTNLNEHSIHDWINVYRQADSLQLNAILPIYLTHEKSLYFKFDNQVYYLMPWIEASQTPALDIFYNCLGEIHAQTKRKITLPKLNKIDEFEQYNRYSQALNRQLISYVETFEKRLFMSPFELQVCTHYHQMEALLGKLSEKTKRFIKLYKDETEWNISLCHGNLSLSHVLGGSDLKLINFESGSFDNSTSDLTVFFRNETGAYDAPIDSFQKNFSNYMKVNKLNHVELALLQITMMNPTPYMTIIEEYINSRSKYSMIEFVKRLESSYRQLQFALTFSNHIEDEYESIFNDEETD